MQRPASRASISPSATPSARASPSRAACSSTPGRWKASAPRACSRPNSAGAPTKRWMPDERAHPRLRLRRRDLHDAARRRHPRALVDADGAGAARLPRHPQRGDLDRGLFHAARGRPRRSIGRPATMPIIRATMPCCRCTKWSAAPWRCSDELAHPRRARNRRRRSTNSACCSTATPRTPIGTARSSRSRRRAQLAPYQNATGMQVTSAVLAGMVWMLENPDRGIVEADEMDFRRCLEIQRPYLGPMIGRYTDWTRLDGRGRPVPGEHRSRRSLAVQQRAGAINERAGAVFRHRPYSALSAAMAFSMRRSGTSQIDGEPV